MSTLKFTQAEHWADIERHLGDARGERFAFALTKMLHNGQDGPVLEVVDVILIDDAEIEPNNDGWYLSEDALDAVHNQARSAGRGLVEFHNHRAGPPGFSAIDERALAEMSRYTVDLLGGTPYGAAVWAQGAIRADWWCPGPDATLERSPFRTVTVLGEHLKVLNAEPGIDERFTRQIPLLGPGAQAAIAALRVGLVGAGGTGSHISLALAYLGFRDLVILDDDLVDTTNLNRLVTAEQADLQSPNQIAIDTRTPLLDIATGVDVRGTPVALGGRIALVLPGEACLTCQRELDSAEISRWAKPEHERALDRAHGYGTGTANPSVVYLNGLAVNAALAEIGAWLSGARPPARWLDIDLIGTAAYPGTQIGPRRVPPRDPGCIDCANAA